MANPNIVNTTAIYGKTDVLSVSTTAVSITSNPASSGKVFKVNAVVLSNIDGSSPVDASVEIYRSSTSYFIAKTISIPADSSIVIVGRDNPIYLNEGDSLRAVASSNNKSQAVCSYEEIS